MGVPLYHLIFGLCNIKQLNFRHFNINSKFHPERNKISSKIVGKQSEDPSNVYDHLRRFPKTTEDFRGQFRKCFDYIPRTNSSFIISTRKRKTLANVPVIDMFICERYMFYSVKTEIFSVRDILVIH